MHFLITILYKIKEYLFKNDLLLKDYNIYLKKKKSRILNYAVLFYLIFYHAVLRQKKLVFNKKKKLTKLENTISSREPIENLVEKLAKYDVISFDIFDTLVFRPFEKPSDCFYLLESDNGLLSFSQYRKDAEKEARKNTEKPNAEIDIFDIYEELKNYYNISDSFSMAEKEIELEKIICYANPYMFEIYKRLIEKNKKIIAVSDMYIPEKYMKQILDSCGYKEISEIFVSCDYGVSKVDGKLQKQVHEKLGKGKTIIHIDDNKLCINGCKKTNWETYYYQQCNEIGFPYRTTGTNSPVSQMYKGIVNNYLHCGAYRLNPQEEIGFAYAGIAVCGYAEWINDFCKQNKCDKILFLARDMDIFYKVYDQYYGDIPHEYVQSSRNALRQLCFEYCPGDFFEYVIESRVGLNKTIEDVLYEADLDFLIETAKSSEINLNSNLLDSNKRDLMNFILKNKEKVIEFYNKGNEPAKQYFNEKIGDAKKVCFAGLGWAGTEIIYLKWLIQNKWKLPVEVIGTVFGMYNKERANMLNNIGSIKPFSFCNNNNSHLNFETTNSILISILAIEHIFTSTATSLLKYTKDEIYKNNFITEQTNPNKEIIVSIQKGIDIFVKEFIQKEKSFKNYLPISGVDAYAPLYSLLDNYKYLSLTLGDFVEKPRAISGNSKDKDYIPLKKLLK